MAERTVEQRAARDAQKTLGCSYNAALLVARSEAAKTFAERDTSPKHYRKRLADAVIAILQSRSG